MAGAWNEGSWSDNSWGTDVNTVSVTGISLSSSIGQPAAFPEFGWGGGEYGEQDWGQLSDGGLIPNSLLATTSLSSVSIETLTTIEQAGIGLTSSIGTAESDVLNNGWGARVWGFSVWGSVGDVILTGQELTASTGQAIASIDVDVQASSLSATTSIGSSASRVDVDISQTGISLTSSVGNSTTEGTATILPTSATATTTTGQATIDPTFLIGEGWGRDTFGNLAWGVNYSVIGGGANGIELTSTIGNEDAFTDVTVAVSGSEAQTAITPVGTSANSDNEIAHSFLLTGSLGDLTFVGNALVQPTNQAPNFEFTAQGNAALSTDQFKFGTASLELDGTDDYVDTTTNLDLSSTDFTIDVWIRPNSVTGYKGIWQSGTSTTEQSYLLGNQVYWTVTPSTIITSSVTVNANEWTMLSYERQGNTHRIYKNGTLEDTATTANKQDNGPFSIGENGFGDFNGYIDEFRVSDIARYGGSSFIEPTEQFTFDTDTQFLLHFDGTDGSTTIKSADDTLFASTSAIGDAVGGTIQEVPVTGIELTTNIGNEDTSGNANISVTGIEATSATGDIVPVSTYDATGSSATATAGQVTVTGQAIVIPTGISLTASTGSPNIIAWAEVDTGTPVTWSEVDLAA